MPLATALLAIALLPGAPSPATDLEAEAAVRSTMTAMEVYYTDFQTYAGATIEELAAIEPSIARTGGLRISRRTASTYRIAVRAATGRTFKVTRKGSGADVFRYTCTPRGKGGCPRDGAWAG